jgi:hypothetical protein
MTMQYKLGNVYRIKLKYGLSTYVILVEHLHSFILGFRSMAAPGSDPSVPLNILKGYEHELVCGCGTTGYQAGINKLMAEIGENKPAHERMWRLQNAQGHYNSDAYLNSINSQNN